MFYSTASVLTIKDLAPQISAMAPIIISVNGGEYYWSDDIDVTNINELEQNMREYRDMLNLNMIVTNISFDIVDYHHSIVRITTVK